MLSLRRSLRPLRVPTRHLLNLQHHRVGSTSLQAALKFKPQAVPLPISPIPPVVARTSFWKSFLTSFREKPVLMNSLSGIVIFGAGDVMSQLFTLHRQNLDVVVPPLALIDWVRAAKISLLGLGFNGIGLYGWYKALDMIVKSKSLLTNTISKVVLDQVIWSPICIIAYTMYTSFVLHAADARQAINHAKEKLLGLWIADCCVWPVANFFAFSIIPTYVRPFYIGIVQLAWQSYLNLVTTGKVPPLAFTWCPAILKESNTKQILK